MKKAPERCTKGSKLRKTVKKLLPALLYEFNVRRDRERKAAKLRQVPRWLQRKRRLEQRAKDKKRLQEMLGISEPKE